MVIRNIFGLFLFLFSFCYSCNSQVPLRVRKNFKFCYDTTVNYSQSYIKLNGYYLLKYPPYQIVNYDNHGIKIVYDKDTTFVNLMFFQDGVFVLGETKSNRTFYEIDYLKKIEQKIQPESEQFYNGQYWGIYRIEGDTLKMQYISHQPKYNPYWALTGVWYEMRNENTLKVLYTKDYTHDNRGAKTDDENIVVLEFIETNIQLPSDTWLKKEEWFWCDKEKFNAWKKEKKK